MGALGARRGVVHIAPDLGDLAGADVLPGLAPRAGALQCAVDHLAEPALHRVVRRHAVELAVLEAPRARLEVAQRADAPAPPLRLDRARRPGAAAQRPPPR